MAESRSANSGREREGTAGQPGAGSAGDEPDAPEYSFTRIMVVFLFSHVVGLAGGIALALIFLAPLALPWWLVLEFLGDEIGPLAILFTGGGFASGCFLNIQLPQFRARFLLLFIGNPAFVFFLLLVLNPDAVGSIRIPGFTLDQSLQAAALFAAYGVFCAVLGDRYAWRHKVEAGIG